MDLNIVNLQLRMSAASFSELSVLVGSAVTCEALLRTLICKSSLPDCTGCSDTDVCPFIVLCGRKLSPDPELVSLHQRPGVPFIFNNPKIRNDKELEFGLVLLGPAIQHLELFVRLFSHCAGRNDSLYGISVRDYQQRQKLLSDSGLLSDATFQILSAATMVDLATPLFAGCQQALIQITSPLRMVHNGRELNHFQPDLFIKAVLRRISSLAAYYGTAPAPDQFRGYAQMSSQFQLVSYRQGQPCRRGVSGDFVVKGPWDELGPLLAFGGIVHLGKGSSYGNGAYAIVPYPGSVSNTV